MGTMSHDAIIVVGYSKNDVMLAQTAVLRLAATPTDGAQPMQECWSDLVSPLMSSVMNAYASFYIAPDGSKEGWGTSDRGDQFRESVIAELGANHPNVTVVEVRWGELGDKMFVDGREADPKPW